jgi:predicted lipoprotein
MTDQTIAAPPRKPMFTTRRVVIAGVVAAVVAAMVLDTTVVRIGSEADVRADVFSPETFGAEKFPSIQSLVEERAVDAATLATAVLEDKAAAGEQYGTAAGIGPVMPVKFTGVAGEVKAGNYDVAIDGVPEEIRVRVQTGPAINGTELRDFPGDIAFGDFKNQIEYQNAGSGINNAMKEQVLADVETGDLTGKTIHVTGVFKLISEKNWLVTPVRLSVE